MSENKQKKPDTPDEEADALSDEDLDKVSGGTDVSRAGLTLEKTKLKASQTVVNPLVNQGMEKNDAEELPGGMNTKTVK